MTVAVPSSVSSYAVPAGMAACRAATVDENAVSGRPSSQARRDRRIAASATPVCASSDQSCPGTS